MKSRLPVAPSVLLLLLLGSAAGAAGRSAAALGGPSEGISRRTLANGLTLVYEKDASSPLTDMVLVVRGGQRAEPEGQAGLAFLTTRLLLEIPDSRSAQELMHKSSASGLAVQGDLCLITIESLSSHFEDTLRIMSGPLLDPLFSGIRIDRLTQSMAHRAKIVEDDPVHLGHEAQVRAVFGDSAYGAPPLGTEESLKSLKGRTVSDFYKTWFRTGNASLVVVSDMDEAKAAAMVEAALQRFPAGPAASLAPLKPFPDLPRKAFLARDTRQTLVSYGFRLPATTPRTYALAALVETLLGKGPGSRLWPLRQEKGLAYNIDADVTAEKEAGLLEVYLETDEGREAAAGAALENALEKVRTADIGPDELEGARTMTKARILRDNETKDRRCQNRAVWEALGLGADFLERFAAEVESVTAAELADYLAKALDLEHASLVVVGPKDLNAGPAGQDFL
jgi:zinc protease